MLTNTHLGRDCVLHAGCPKEFEAYITGHILDAKVSIQHWQDGTQMRLQKGCGQRCHPQLQSRQRSFSQREKATIGYEGQKQMTVILIKQSLGAFYKLAVVIRRTHLVPMRSEVCTAGEKAGRSREITTVGSARTKNKQATSSSSLYWRVRSMTSLPNFSSSSKHSLRLVVSVSASRRFTAAALAAPADFSCRKYRSSSAILQVVYRTNA